MRIQHNIMAMNAYRNYNNNTKALSGNLEKLSSGYKINRAGDDAAGLAISEKMRAQITGLNAAQKNVKDGISLVKTAEGAMQEIQDMLNRMDYLATQSANGTYQDEVDRENLQKEVTALKDEINRIADSANFNGIKLLNGSLAEKQVATSAKVENLISYASVGAAGKYTTTALPEIKSTNFTNGANGANAWKPSGDPAATKGLSEGDSYEYTVSLSDGSSTTIKLTMEKNDDGELKNLVAEDGTVYEVTQGFSANKQYNDVKQGELDSAILSELKKTGLNDQFKMTSDGTGKFTFEAKEVGTSTPAVAAADAALVNGQTGERFGNQAATNSKVAVAVETPARDVGREIKADDITEYDGTNFDEAVFTINGKKFVLLTNTQDGTTAHDPATNDEYLRAVQGLGSDVTVLVGGRGGLKSGAAAGTGPVQGDAANSNFTQNIKKIAEVTGLTVTDAVAEAAATGANPGQGIRLSAGKGTTDGGLTLQIGDTADSFNQMKVKVGDMHVKALGINSVDISTQAGAQTAIATVKDAINYVSSVRGDLGAVQNRLEHTQNNLSVMAENIQDAESTIRDTDVAEEMMSYVKNNILVQSAQAMLAQANQVPQGVLQLLG